jgi:hypothetical protein
METMCPHCKTLFRTQPQFKGRKGPCPKCRQPFVVEEYRKWDNPKEWTEEELTAAGSGTSFPRRRLCPRCGGVLAHRIDRQTIKRWTTHGVAGQSFYWASCKHRYVCIQCSIVRCMGRDCTSRATRIRRQKRALVEIGSTSKCIERHDVWICDQHAAFLRTLRWVELGLASTFLACFAAPLLWVFWIFWVYSRTGAQGPGWIGLFAFGFLLAAFPIGFLVVRFIEFHRNFLERHGLDGTELDHLFKSACYT